MVDSSGRAGGTPGRRFRWIPIGIGCVRPRHCCRLLQHEVNTTFSLSTTVAGTRASNLDEAVPIGERRARADEGRIRSEPVQARPLVDHEEIRSSRAVVADKVGSPVWSTRARAWIESRLKRARQVVGTSVCRERNPVRTRHSCRCFVARMAYTAKSRRA